MTDADSEPELLKDPDGLEAPEDLEDDAKRKFREALDRKRAREADTAGGLGGKSTGKVRGVHGPASSRRSFRRRGGG
jgi:hypothetical protein